MPRWLSMQLSKDELRTRTDSLDQIAGVRKVVLSEGVESGVEVFEFWTGSGLCFDVVASRGMDISRAQYCGRSLSWRSATGDAAPAFFEPEGLGWLRTFYGGLLVTCGLTYFGPPCEDEGELLGLHGRISHLPARRTACGAGWEDDDYVIWAQGEVVQARVFAEHLRLTRRISTRLGESRLWVHDVVENLAHERSPHMILYHVNPGYPAVDAGAQLLAPVVSTRPRDAEAEKGAERFNVVEPPVPGFKEKVYFHRMKGGPNGEVTVATVNPAFNGGEGFGVYIRYNLKELPNFTQWKMNAPGTYVQGMEPSNCPMRSGRALLRERDELPHLEPGETKEYHLEIGALLGPEAIEAIREEVEGQKGG